MGITNYSKCPICESSLQHNIQSDLSDVLYVNCPACGRFAINEEYYEDFIDRQFPRVTKSEIASYLHYQENRIPHPFLCGEKTTVPSNHRRVSLEEIRSWYPKAFSDKVDMFLLNLAKRMNFMGEPVLFSPETLYSACFVNREPQGPMKNLPDTITAQARYFEKYIIEQGYVTPDHNGFVIQPKGLERIDGLQRDAKSRSKDVFVSMSFSNNTKETREALKKAIIDAHFSPEFIDEIIHNKQIVPEMFRLIRECRFLILEISDPNYGAYYEAGYALGLGKEIIICCSREAFERKYETEEEKKYAKYLKPHFDIAQKQILVWDDYADLQKKLAEWIKALFR